MEGDFGALAQVIGRTAISFLRKFVVPVANSVSADLMEFAVLEKIEFVKGTKKSQERGQERGMAIIEKIVGLW